MAGRKAHGRAPNAKPLGKSATKAKSRKAKVTKSAAQAKARAHDAFEIASELHPQVEKKTPRNRQLDPEAGHKHGRDEDDDEEDSPKRKRARGGGKANDDSDVEYGSDEEGNKWRLGGPVGDEDDSEIESDDAFGESDEEKFQDFTFAGSRTKKNKDAGSDDEEEDEDDDESLGEEAIDLATALDRAEAESSEEEEVSGSEDDSEAESSGSDSDTDIEDAGDDLKDLMSKYGASEAGAEPGKPKKKEFALLDEDEDKPAKPTKPKIDLGDLDLTGITDRHMKNAVKLMAKEEKARRPGTSKKLAIPLAKRLQDQIDRKAAYEKTTETLDRWSETVQHYRRADHIMFPLPQETPTADMLNNAEFQPLKPKDTSTELEKTMFSLLEQSGLNLNKEPKKKAEPSGPDLQASKELIKKHNEEMVKQRRKEREMQSREAQKNARLKKIKSKAFHRVHRKQKQRDMQDDDEEVDSEDEREAQDRRRALERVGARHKNSAWAKSGSKVKRAVWDDDYRAGLTEMARRDQDLRKRIEGRTGSDSEEESSESEIDSEAEKGRLLRKLDEAEAEDTTPRNGILNMPFMQRSEQEIKKANADLIKQIRRDMNSGSEEESEEEAPVIGRRTYGPTSQAALLAAKAKPAMKKTKSIVPGAEQADDDVEIITHGEDATGGANDDSDEAAPKVDAWTRGKPRKAPSRVHDLTILNNEEDAEVMAPAPEPKSTSRSRTHGSKSAPQSTTNAPQPKKSRQTTAKGPNASAFDDSDGEAEPENFLDESDKLIAEAFGGGDEMEDEFQREKAELAEEEADKVIDNTLPGWGSWVGDGVSAKDRKKHKGRFLQTVDGVQKEKRKDAKLQRVIISEKRIKKNEKFLASQLPFPFENKEQYERSLRLPVGKEWVTKETFQDGTKPRIIVKQGIINPISKPVM